MKTILKVLLHFVAIFLIVVITYIFTPRPYMVHWHANFAVFVDGKAWDFSPSAYMEETSRCNITTGVKPQDRIHLHDNKGNLVHVHMAAATWGDLFANLRFGIGTNYIADTYDELHISNDTKHLYYFINGKPVNNPANEVVQSTDRLLVWYGTGTESEIKEKFDSLVPNDAHEYNEKADPASCSTNTYGWLSPVAEPVMEWLEHHK